MRIVHICQRDDPDTGGSLRVAEALVREQRKAGHDARLLFLYGKEAHVSGEFGEAAITLGLHSSRQALKGMFTLAHMLRKISPDVIHSHDGIIWPRLVFISFRIPVVMHSHLPLRSTDSRLGCFLVKKTTKLLIGISLHTIETWVKDGFPPARIHFIPNGVDLARFSVQRENRKNQLRRKLGLPIDKHILLWVGRVHRNMKGSDRVERVARLLPEDIVLVVVGNGPEYEGLCERNRPLVEAGSLFMVGSCDYPENYYQAADEFLFTSYHEPFGLVILEAVASGLPILAFPVTGGGGAVQLLEDFHAAELDDAATDTELRNVLGQSQSRLPFAPQNMKLAVNRYSWKPLSERVVDIYRIALMKRR